MSYATSKTINVSLINLQFKNCVDQSWFEKLIHFDLKMDWKISVTELQGISSFVLVRESLFSTFFVFEGLCVEVLWGF